MARRRHHEEHENHERWLVSYADFITLLFAFFVVMYSISSINEGKYKIISQALVGVFNDAERALKPIPIGEERPKTVTPAKPLVNDSDETAAGVGGTSDPLKSIADDISAAFGDLISSNQMTVRGNELWVEIELNSSLLFGSGDAMPSDIAFNIIDKVGAILKPFDNPIHVEGFTDVPLTVVVQIQKNLPVAQARLIIAGAHLVVRTICIARTVAIDVTELHATDLAHNDGGRGQLDRCGTASANVHGGLQ